MGDMFDPEVYYAAGILAWAELHRKDNFAKKDLSRWLLGGSGSYDVYSNTYFQNDTILIKAIDYLLKIDAIEGVEDKYGPTVYEIMLGGHLRDLSEKYVASPFWRAERYGIDWIKSAIQKVSEEPDPVGAEELEETAFDISEYESDVWEPLRIDHADPLFTETVESIETSIREIAADNGFSSTYPEERDNLVEHATATLESAKDGKVTRHQVRQNFIAAGKWIAEKFGGTAIGALGSELVKLGLRLLGWMP